MVERRNRLEWIFDVLKELIPKPLVKTKLMSYANIMGSKARGFLEWMEELGLIRFDKKKNKKKSITTVYITDKGIRALQKYIDLKDYVGLN